MVGQFRQEEALEDLVERVGEGGREHRDRQLQKGAEQADAECGERDCKDGHRDRPGEDQAQRADGLGEEQGGTKHEEQASDGPRRHPRPIGGNEACTMSSRLKPAIMAETACGTMPEPTPPNWPKSRCHEPRKPSAAIARSSMRPAKPCGERIGSRLDTADGESCGVDRIVPIPP